LPSQSELELSLKLKEDQILKAKKNRMLSAIIEPKREGNREKCTKRSFKICIYNITRALLCEDGLCPKQT
jgi:hypothetical protein